MSYLRVRLAYVSAGKTISFKYYDGYIITGADGLDELSLTIDETANLDGIGAAVQRVRVPPRPITLTGYIVDRPAERCRAELIQTVLPMQDGRLWAEDENGAKWYLDCTPAAVPFIEMQKRLPRFQVQLRAMHPYWQAETETEKTITATVSSPGSAAVFSAAPAIYRFTATASGGSVNGLTIRCGGKSFVYTGTLSAGQTLTVSIRTDGRVSALKDGSSVIGDTSGLLRKLPAGENTVTAALGSGSSGSCKVKIYYREAIAGV